jgi:hypothetical protein
MGRAWVHLYNQALRIIVLSNHTLALMLSHGHELVLFDTLIQLLTG